MIDEKENEDKFFEDLLEDKEPETEKSDERDQKNRDAEEARKRREAEAKAKADEEAKKKAEEDAKAKADEEAKKKAAEEVEAKKKTEQTSKLGEQLIGFKKKYPDVELSELDGDKNFKKFIDGKLLGKKDFTQLYEEYLEIRSELSGKTQDEVKRNYERKANSGSGTATPRGNGNPTDVYSEEEFDKITKRLPLMSESEANKVMAKFEKSAEYYKKNKK